MELENFIRKYPQLYHMAEAGAWPSIQQYGLLSTSAILNLHSKRAGERILYEQSHREEMMIVSSNHVTDISLRDQKPMPPSRLQKGLPNSITPNEWYSFLNSKVFFWASRERLERLSPAM